MTSEPIPDYDTLDRLLAGVELAPSPAEAQAILCGLLAVQHPDPIGRWHAQMTAPSGERAPDDDAREPDASAVAAAIDITFDGRSSAGGQGAPPGPGHAPAAARGHAHCDHPDHAHDHTGTCDHDHHRADHEPGARAEADAMDSALAALARWTEVAIAPPSVSFDLLLPPDDRPLRERALAVHDWVRGLLFGLVLGGLDRDGLDGQAREAFDDLVELTRMDLAAIEEDEADEQALAEIVEFLRVAAMAIRESVGQSAAEPGAVPQMPGSRMEVH